MVRGMSDRTFYLYRHFDAAEKLLYVGVSADLLKRCRRHEQESRWFNKIACIKVARFATIGAALRAEKMAIDTEKPQFNSGIRRANGRSSSAGSGLRKWRLSTKTSLSDLAQKVGCSASALSLIERGERVPSYDMTRRIVNATGGKVKAADLHNGAT